MKDDYQYVKTIAQQNKQQKVMDDWVDKRIEESYIKIMPGLHECNLKPIWQDLIAEN